MKISADVRQLYYELADLVALPGPSGAEDTVAAWITTRLADLPIIPTLDSLGNLRLVPAGGMLRVLVTAHMDQVGYMVSRVDRKGAYCLPVGGPRIDQSRTARVRVVGTEHPTLIAELESFGDEGGIVRSNQLGDIRIGDRVIFANELEVFDGRRVRGPALDNRIGCLVALHAAHILVGDQSNVGFAWTVREETEQAGVVRVARDLHPDLIVSVDITYATAADAANESVVAVGGGPAITLLDGGMVGHGGLVRAFDVAANGLAMRWQPEVVRSGASEAGQVQRLLGIPALALLVAIENPHSNEEIADLEDVASAIDLLVAGVRELT